MKTATLLLLVLLWASTASGLRVEFAEDDVSESEGAGPLVVVLSVFGLQENDNVTVELIPMTVDDFLSTHQVLPSGAMNRNPAEPNDFNSSVHTVVLTSNGDTSVEIEIFDDNIAELDEVFLIVLKVVNIPSNELLEDGRNVSVARIRMDNADMATIEFSEVGFSVPENAGNVSEVRVVKTGEIEDSVRITVQLQTLSDQATKGVDFDLEVDQSGNMQLVFDPTFESLTVNFTIMEDLLPESVETFQLRLDGSSLAQLIIGTNTTITISIVDNDALTVGFDQQTLELEEGQRDEICVVLLQPDEIQFFLDLTISIDLGSATEDQFDLDSGCLSPNTDRKYDLTLFEGETSCCFTVTTMDDDTLEESRVFTIKVEEDSLSPSNPLLTLEPDVVTVTITDNDGTPSAPTNLEAELVNDDKDLLITWDADLTDPLRPINQFLIRVNISSIPTTQETKQDSGVDMQEFDTDDTQFTISDIDPDKQYTIVVCSNNTFGENCTDPLSLSPVPIPGALPTEDSSDSGLDPGIIALIVIMAFLLALLCCILLIILLFCLIKDPLRSYYPEKREKTYGKEREEELKEVQEFTPGESDKV